MPDASTNGYIRISPELWVRKEVNGLRIVECPYDDEHSILITENEYDGLIFSINLLRKNEDQN